jgi:hypothetical protein
MPSWHGLAKGWRLGPESWAKGREAIVALGWVQARVNSWFCQFLLGLFQISFELGSNSIDFVSNLGFWSSYFPNWIPIRSNKFSQILFITFITF